MVRKTIQLSGFSLDSNAETVKNLLEIITGPGSIFALKFRHPKSINARSKAFVVVQFQIERHAQEVFNLAERGSLPGSGCNLKARYMERDIVPKPRTFAFESEDTKLHVGCLISNRSMNVIWSVSSVQVKFGFNLRKIYFNLSWRNNLYKLELSYESIWEIQLHRSSVQSSQFLLIQIQAAPKIYELSQCNSQEMWEDPSFNYFREIPDDKWIRSTDFSPSSSIGQSSILCLQFPYNYSLPNIREYFVYYEEFNGYFDVQQGSSYCRNTDLVPIVQPHWRIPYEILFKVNHMVQNGTLSGPTLDEKFFSLVTPGSTWPVRHIEHALETMSHSKKTCLDPSVWLSKHYSSLRKSVYVPKSAQISLEDGLVYVHRVQITPSKVYFYGPEINVSNRVLRHYKDDLNNFLRISFVDEDCEKLHSTDLSSKSDRRKQTSLYKRVLSVLMNGITIGDKKFEFLAFSSSQLRENSAWMFASRRGLTASSIRSWLGEFLDIRNVAKYAARLGQSLSASTETLTVQRDEVDHIPDITILDVTNGTKYVFSDGIGKISFEFATKVAKKCRLKGFTPSAFQIRYGGYKGVVAIDPTSSKKLSLRKSMSKFQSENITLDVLAYTKYQPCYLNRQLITLLSTLGVGDLVFKLKQEEAVDQLNQVLTDPKRAYEAVELMSPGETTNLLKELLLCGYKPDSEPFLSMMLHAFWATRMFELRTKSRIFVPKGRALMGCLDETRSLEYGEVFIQVSTAGCGSHFNASVVTSMVVVAKNPCLHPGDVKVLQAIDVPDLHHMVDCVVFPQKGKRPHPNECSGSDLDGDIYFVSWDPCLIPTRVVEPMDYTPAPAVTLDHDVTMDEVKEYFVNYIVNDSLGIIANAHTVFADREPQKAESKPCLELARLFSIAVDFPKTGVPAEIPQDLYVKEYPDFMEKLDKVTYVSKGVIGKLYRAIKEDTSQPGHIRHFTKEVARQRYDPDMEVDGFRDFIEEASWYKEDYDFKLGNLMDHYGIKTEAELVTGYISKMSKTFTKYKDGEAIRLAVRSLRKEARSWFSEKSTDNDDDGEGDEMSYAKASAWYHVAYHPNYWGCYNEGLNRPHFISFPWCVYDKLTTIKKRRMAQRRIDATEVEEIVQNFGRGLNIF
ncbi:RNA-dependent RNA polymerase [Rhynchospora pubera]|uniref:RNA-dependent RNA polymerase n=1 Tax=Rhynchospora pubera TaxID=906938 RepID=A0AAV8DA85_9POAL|nr:RNA-dependent RNA polymerase [Rhynchospora pubera]